MRHRKIFISISLCRLLSVCHVSLSQRSDLPRERMCSWTILAEKVAATASQAVLQDGLNSFLFLYLKCSKLPLNLLCYTASPTKHSLSRCTMTDMVSLSLTLCRNVSHYLCLFLCFFIPLYLSLSVFRFFLSLLMSVSIFSKNSLYVSHRRLFIVVYYDLFLVGSSVTRLGDLLDFGQLFKAFGSYQLAQIFHILRQFL